MRTIQPSPVTVYSFSELSDNAKRTACMRAESFSDYPFSDHAMKSIKALAEFFGCEVKDYSIDYSSGSHSWMSFAIETEFSEDEMSEHIERLGSFNPETGKGNGDCVLTGYCMDEDAIDGLRAAYRDGERWLDDLLQAGFRSWLKAVQADYAYQYSFEGYGETADANELEFKTDGTLYIGK